MEINKTIFDGAMPKKHHIQTLNWSSIVLDALMEASTSDRDVYIEVATHEAEVVINKALDALVSAGDGRALQIMVRRVPLN
tara:strand:+ start:705 stop:947 length:243 start_codon:yes stop_codon:yes gene_type:complete